MRGEATAAAKAAYTAPARHGQARLTPDGRVVRDAQGRAGSPSTQELCPSVPPAAILSVRPSP
ncbi:MAG: hypothetical protein KatS3mg111_2630 [Pirellulaceae bacterium]|nr:MAG: hypothetical protein KatS3mg111_2630 [Pirellulaceae bacterium]